jgi:hypothetical protein
LNVSRNALFRTKIASSVCNRLLGLLLPLSAFSQSSDSLLPLLRDNAPPPARVVIVHDAEATEAFQPRPERILPMVNRGLAALTGKSTPGAAWRSLLSTQDVDGLQL